MVRGIMSVFRRDRNLVFLSLNVLDVARYVVNYSNEKDYGISNLKLQKVLYFGDVDHPPPQGENPYTI